MTIETSGVLSPGASATGNYEVVGSLDGGNVSLAAGSTFTFQFLGGLQAYDSVNMMDDPTGLVDADDASYQLANGAGTAWDLLYASTLNLTGASPSNRVNLKVVSMSDLRTPGVNPNLDPNAKLGTVQTQHWLFANTGGINYAGGDINDYFAVDSSQVTPPADAPYYGSFYVTMVGNDLYLNYAAVPEPGSLLLMGIAGIGFGIRWKKRRERLAEEAATLVAAERNCTVV